MVFSWPLMPSNVPCLETATVDSDSIRGRVARALTILDNSSMMPSNGSPLDLPRNSSP
jgi:hypothetical protein